MDGKIILNISLNNFIHSKIAYTFYHIIFKSARNASRHQCSENIILLYLNLVSILKFQQENLIYTNALSEFEDSLFAVVFFSLYFLTQY